MAAHPWRYGVVSVAAMALGLSAILLLIADPTWGRMARSVLPYAVIFGAFTVVTGYTVRRRLERAETLPSS